MAKIKVDTAKLSATEQNVREQLAQIQAALKTMQSDVTALNAMWSGEANQAFNSTFQKDIQDLQELCEGLKEIAEYEANAKKEYTDCERSVASIINAIRIAD